MVATVDTPIALEAKDLIPETWDALAEARTFGPDALQRRHDRVIRKIFGILLTDDEMEILDDSLIEYAGKMLGRALLDPGIEYWSRQILTRTAGERESSTYKDRASDLRQLKIDWAVDLAELWPNVEPFIPDRPQPAGAAPSVVQAGDTIPHLTPNVFDDLEPEYGAAADTAT